MPIAMALQTLTPQERQLVEANGGDPDALEANQAGTLTPKQAQRVRSQRRRWGAMLVIIAAVCIVVGGANLLPSGQKAGSGDFWGALTALLAGVALLALRFSSFGRSYAAEISDGRLHHVEGFVRIHSSSSDGHTSYHLQIDGREFETTEAGAKAIDPRSRYRIYCLPGSEIMVNIESLGSALACASSGSPLLREDEIAAIVGEPMRAESEASQVAEGGWPGVVQIAFTGANSGLHVSVAFLLGADGNSAVLNVYRHTLARGTDARPIDGLGDEATYRGGQLLVRRGDAFVSVNLMSLQNPRAVFAAERSFDIARRVAALALQRLR